MKEKTLFIFLGIGIVGGILFFAGYSQYKVYNTEQQQLNQLVEERDKSLVELDKAYQDYYNAVEKFNNRESQPLKSIVDKLPTQEKLNNSIFDNLP